MKLKALGRSSLAVAPLAFGGNVFGWSADEATSFALLDAFVDAGFNLVDTADVYSHWVPGNEGGESETHPRPWLRRSGKRDRVTIATKVGKWARAARPVAGQHPPGGGGFAATPADRLHRPVPGARGRPGRAAGRHARRLRPADRAGQGARDRRLQLQRRSPGRSAGHVRAATACRATRACSRNTTSTTAPVSRPSSSRWCAHAKLGVISYYSLASGFLSGKYRSAGRRRQERGARRRDEAATSTRAACGSCRRWTTSPPPIAQRPRRSRWPG